MGIPRHTDKINSKGL